MGERYIFTIRQLTKTYNKKEVLKDIWLAFYPGAKIGVIGGNGAGKSTLLRIMSGLDNDFVGEAQPDNGISIGFVPQEPRLTPDTTVLDNIEEAVAGKRAILKRHQEIGDQLGDPEADFDKLMEEMGKLQDLIDAQNLWDLDRHLEMAMDAMRLPPGDARVEQLSGGERRRVALCKVLLQKPDLLLLDEPTNHLDAESGRLAGKALGGISGHGRRGDARSLLPGQCRQVDPGIGPRPRFPLRGQLHRLAGAKEIETGDRGEAGVGPSQGAGARTGVGPHGPASSDREKQGPTRRISTNWQAQDYEEREDELYHPDSAWAARWAIWSSAPTDCSKATATTCYWKTSPSTCPGRHRRRHRSQRRRQDDAFPNDCRPGESGRGQADGWADGEVPLTSIRIATRSTATNTIFEEITGGADHIMLGKNKVASRGYVARFNFKGPDQQKKVGDCSGGERNRIHLAKLLRSGGNLLLLDEPTNDLDVDTLRALEEALLNFGGCAVVISHDRWFLDRIATHILAFEGESKAVWCEGNYHTYEEQRHQRLGAEADQSTPAQISETSPVKVG